jgi:hypothetical protein
VITLTNVEGTRLYQAERSAEPGFLTYYVSDDQGLVEDLPHTLTVDEAWSEKTLHGYFLFLTKEPLDIRVFAAVVAEHPFAVPKHTSFAWVQYEQGPPPTFTVAYDLNLEFDENEEHVVIATGATFNFGGYWLPFMPQGLVQPVKTDDGIHQFSFEYPLSYPPDAPPDLPPLPRAEGTGVNVPLSGPQRYVLQSLSLIGDFSNDASQGFNAGVRYFYEQGGKVLSQFYPIFATSGDGYQVEFQINWDPLDPLNRNRSWMKFTGNAYLLKITGEGQGRIEVAPNANVLPSWLRTIYGKPLWLRPVLHGEHAAKLVMQPMPPDSSGRPKFYMVPDGDYELLGEPTGESAGDGARLNLLCGLAGTESIGFSPGTRAVPLTLIRFHPWKPAFAPVFPLTDASSGITASGALRSQALADSPLLTDTWPTAWVSIAPSGATANTETIYHAQPEQAALYDKGSAATATATNILQLYQAPVAEFTKDSLDQSYPLAMYAGLADSKIALGFPSEDVRRFEVQILNRVRKEMISKISVGQRALATTKETDVEPPLVMTTTPQGLVAKVQGLDWKSVVLANNEKDGSRLEFTDLGPELREALQSNQLFLVASLAEPLAKPPLGTFQHNITIAGWPFNINVGEGSANADYRNVLIFKFGSGTIKDLVTDPKSWTGAKVFNTDASRMSLFLQNYIASAETSAQENLRFQKFVSLVSNPAWEGILALRVTVGLNEFPDDLKGLLGGIDLTRFVAHHFGIETSFVKSDGELRQARSSLFGLISYIDRGYTTRKNTLAFHNGNRLGVQIPQVVNALDPNAELYDFKVLQLEVVFENSELLDFTSRIQLTTTKWFGEPVKLQSGYPPDPIDDQSIDLIGSYEIHNGQRSYSFYTDPAQTYKFLVTSNVLNYVQIVKARFETLRSEPKADGSENIFTRFSFWGYLNFKTQPGFDLFSFGSEANPQLSEKEGLYFSNLGITMDFTLLANKTTGTRAFAFDAGKASYDISQSEVRANSLVNRFPMKITAILQSDGRGSPTDLGYLSVRVPRDFKALRLSSEWYAINFQLNLGSMGALAEKAGFTAELMLAWSPAENVVRAEVQIKLPGTGGGKKLLSLQGVLKLSVQYFEFRFLTKPGMQYQLYFKNMGLSVLGKKLPSEGTTDMVLSGDPDRKLEAGSLAWMAAYYREEKPKKLLGTHWFES